MREAPCPLRNPFSKFAGECSLAMQAKHFADIKWSKSGRSHQNTNTLAYHKINLCADVIPRPFLVQHRHADSVETLVTSRKSTQTSTAFRLNGAQFRRTTRF
jgi:hypothetical protein